MKYYNISYRERIGYDFYCDIAEKIVEARKGKGMTQAQLAKETGISFATVVAMENVKMRITLDNIEKIAKALDVSPDWLIDAQLDRAGKDCLYLVWNEKFEDLKLYQEATSARMAFLLVHQRLTNELHFRFLEPRDRAIVKLVGVPVSTAELSAKFPKHSGEDEPIESEDSNT